MFLLRKAIFHEKLCLCCLIRRLVSIKSLSCSVTPLTSEGLFLNQIKHTITQINPINPFTKNAERQPNAAVIGITIRGAIAAPAFWPTNNDDRLLEASLAGNQRDTTAVLVGYAPASPIPNKNRTQIKLISPVVAPVSAVNTDHQNTMRKSTARWPMRSPKTP